jgi:hypothetical protein
MKSQAVKKESKEVVNPLADRAIKALANSIYQNLMSEGCQDKDIIGVSTQLIGLVTHALENKQKK